MEIRKDSAFWHLAWLIPLLILCMLISLSVGASSLSVVDSLRIMLAKIPFLRKVVDISDIRTAYITIVWQVRLPRIIMSALVGGGLAMVGASFQGLFRNPLADPHILGVSSGAAAGATIAMLSGITLSIGGLSAVGIFAFIGALVTVFSVYRIACVGNKVAVTNILLTGTAISSMLSAVISLLMSLNHDDIEKVYMWTLGSFSAATWKKILFLVIAIVAGGIILLVFAKELDLIATGEETAASLGVDTAVVKRSIIIAASLLVAACVSVSGIIGFVGLVIPHCIRFFCGPKHSRLLPLCMVGGAIFMVICDTISRTLIAPSEIPVGVVTALFGAPYFIVLLQRNKRKAGY